MIPCPKCRQNVFDWSLDEERVPPTAWWCRHCGYKAAEDEAVTSDSVRSQHAAVRLLVLIADTAVTYRCCLTRGQNGLATLTPKKQENEYCSLRWANRLVRAGQATLTSPEYRRLRFRRTGKRLPEVWINWQMHGLAKMARDLSGGRSRWVRGVNDHAVGRTMVDKARLLNCPRHAHCCRSRDGRQRCVDRFNAVSLHPSAAQDEQKYMGGSNICQEAGRAAVECIFEPQPLGGSGMPPMLGFPAGPSAEVQGHPLPVFLRPTAVPRRPIGSIAYVMARANQVIPYWCLLVIPSSRGRWLLAIGAADVGDNHAGIRGRASSACSDAASVHSLGIVSAPTRIVCPECGQSEETYAS